MLGCPGLNLFTNLFIAHDHCVTFSINIGRGIQIFWTVNCTAVSQWKIVRSVAAIIFFQWTYSVTFAHDIECGIQIFWTANWGAISQWTIVKKEKDFGYQANKFSLGNGCAIHGSKDLNATFNVGDKSNWVRLLTSFTNVVLDTM